MSIETLLRELIEEVQGLRSDISELRGKGWVDLEDLQGNLKEIHETVEIIAGTAPKFHSIGEKPAPYISLQDIGDKLDDVASKIDDLSGLSDGSVSDVVDKLDELKDLVDSQLDAVKDKLDELKDAVED